MLNLKINHCLRQEAGFSVLFSALASACCMVLFYGQVLFHVGSLSILLCVLHICGYMKRLLGDQQFSQWDCWRNHGLSEKPKSSLCPEILGPPLLQYSPSLLHPLPLAEVYLGRSGDDGTVEYLCILNTQFQCCRVPLHTNCPSEGPIFVGAVTQLDIFCLDFQQITSGISESV